MNMKQIVRLLSLKYFPKELGDALMECSLYIHSLSKPPSKQIKPLLKHFVNTSKRYVNAQGETVLEHDPQAPPRVETGNVNLAKVAGFAAG